MINILFAGNDKIFDGILTCVLSILRRTSTKMPFCFYIYTMDVSYIKQDFIPVSDRKIDFLNRVVKDYNTENRVVKVDVTELYAKEFAGCPNEQAYCSPYTLIRLLADLEEDMPDKLLYLDADILFNRDVTLLYEHDVSSVEYAACRDHYGKFLVYPNYINAGVLLLNIQEIKRTGAFEKARKILREKKLMFADQSALIRSTSKKLIMAQRFNDQKFLHRHTVVRHFSKRLFWLPYPRITNVKQWEVFKMLRTFRYSAFDDIILEYIYLKRKFEREEAK